MAPGRIFHRSVRPGVEYESEDDQEAIKATYSNPTSSEDGFESADEDQDSSEDEQSTESAEEEPPLKDISFGALAKAQESFAPNSRKRKLADREEPSYAQHKEPQTDSGAPNYSSKTDYKAPAHRSSKHAPQIQSSRHAVSRRREIFEPSQALKSRDPRFDATVTASSNDATATSRANKNYSFLSSYQATEILDLKSQIKKSNSPAATANLKKQLMSLEAKLRRADAMQREKDILKRHKEKEKEAIRSGEKSKPFFLKKSDVKKELNTERLNSMNKKARDKAELRKQKREKGKEARGMPRVRREKDVEAG